MTFESLGLSADLLQTVREEGYTEPTPVQAQAIPFVLAGRDVLAAAQTGTERRADAASEVAGRAREAVRTASDAPSAASGRSEQSNTARLTSEASCQWKPRMKTTVRVVTRASTIRKAV